MRQQILKTQKNLLYFRWNTKEMFARLVILHDWSLNSYVMSCSWFTHEFCRHCWLVKFDLLFVITATLLHFFFFKWSQYRNLEFDRGSWNKLSGQIPSSDIMLVMACNYVYNKIILRNNLSVFSASNQINQPCVWWVFLCTCIRI